VGVTRLSLDTSAYSHFKRGDEAVIALVDGADWIGVSTVALGELRTGFRLGKQTARNDRELDQFLANPVVHVLDVDEDASRIYAEIVVALRAAGTPLPTNDIWIAAVSAREGAAVVTYDAHFRQIGRVGSHILDVP
jgi:tRNA(fMet)-specific endonuclease VapC